MQEWTAEGMTRGRYVPVQSVLQWAVCAGKECGG